MYRPTLSLAEIDAFDPQGPPTRKWCALCGNEKPKDAAHRSLSIDRRTGLWKCFRCNESGQAKEFWSNKTSPSRFEQRSHLRAAFDLGPPPPPVLAEPIEAADEAAKPVEAAKPAATDWLSLWEATLPLENTLGQRYLEKRAIPIEVAVLAQVRWSPNWSGNGSVIFPVRDRVGELVAAQGRAIRGSAKITKGPKKDGAFFAPVRMGSGRLCGPLDEAVPAIVLVEAPIDALSIAACGFPAMALCGTSGPEWLHLACGLRSVALAFDADEAGDAAAVATANRLWPYGAQCTRLRPEGFKDWNESLLGQGREVLNDWLAATLLAL
ncbi:hypothetical protein EON80_17630 [bacterium]|nr:MAG: hypothetical protein EON80_17630 [bacterium]